MITVFIPAKGSSERVNGKNLLEIDGKTLLQRTLDFANTLDRVAKIVISTESPEVIRRTFTNLETVQSFVTSSSDSIIQLSDRLFIHKRHPDFSLRHSKTSKLLEHYLNVQNESEGHLLLLQPTTPFRLETDKTFIDSLDLANVKSLFSIFKVESPHPAKTFRKKADGSPHLTEEQISQIQSPAQILGEFFAPDGAFYLTKIQDFREAKSLITKDSKCFERFGYSTINIDTEDDFQYAKYIVEQKLHNS